MTDKCNAMPRLTQELWNSGNPDDRDRAWDLVAECGCRSPSDCLPAKRCLQREPEAE
jgi:hypothetical protein